jgi:arginine decarboxylase
MVLLTNCTFDGVVYNPLRVMEEVLAIKPDICFLWDEAWYAFAIAVPWVRQRTAMVAAERLEERLADPAYVAEYARWKEEMADVPRSEWAQHRLLPDPAKVRVRVYSTHSTHKSLSALRQASMIHVRDQDFNRQSREAFDEAFLTHTSTSPNQQLLASLDLARRQVDIEGFQMVRSAYKMALAFRQRVRADRLISTWFTILEEPDLVPEEYRESQSPSRPSGGQVDRWNESWRNDEFVLDPTRVTLYIGNTGLNGYEFREDVLMDRFGIQINKTSINSVLLIFTIGVTWSAVHYLLEALRRTAEGLERERGLASRAERRLQNERIRSLTTGLPALPDFSDFDPAFRATPTSPDGDIRTAFYAGYHDVDREYVPLRQAAALLTQGRRLVSTTFVVPYPPGFPVLVPGQSISAAIIEFLIKLDVKEIHGYRPELGLSVFTEAALTRINDNRSPFPPKE